MKMSCCAVLACCLFSAFSGEETKEVLVDNPAIAAAFAPSAPKPCEKDKWFSYDKMTLVVDVGALSSYRVTSGALESPDRIITEENTLKFSGVKIRGVNIGDFYLDTWSSVDTQTLAKFTKNLANEQDIGVGWSRAFAGVIKADFSIAYFALADLKTSKDDLTSTVFRLDGIGCPYVTPYVSVQRIDQVKDFGHNPGYFTKFGFNASKDLPGLCLGGKPVAAKFDTSLGTSQGVFSHPAGLVYIQEVMSVPLNVGHLGKSSVSIVPSVRLIMPLDSQTGTHEFLPARRLEAIGGLNIRFTFGS